MEMIVDGDLSADMLKISGVRSVPVAPMEIANFKQLAGTKLARKTLKTSGTV